MSKNKSLKNYREQVEGDSAKITVRKRRVARVITTTTTSRIRFGPL